MMDICNTDVPIAYDGKQAAKLVTGINQCGSAPVGHDERSLSQAKQDK
jgi:hypothetical protein